VGEFWVLSPIFSPPDKNLNSLYFTQKRNQPKISILEKVISYFVTPKFSYKGFLVENWGSSEFLNILATTTSTTPSITTTSSTTTTSTTTTSTTTTTTCLCCVTVQSGFTSPDTTTFTGGFNGFLTGPYNVQVYSNGTVIFSVGACGTPAAGTFCGMYFLENWDF
jgi:hypothetical protein